MVCLFVSSQDTKKMQKMSHKEEIQSQIDYRIIRKQKSGISNHSSSQKVRKQKKKFQGATWGKRFCATHLICEQGELSVKSDLNAASFKLVLKKQIATVPSCQWHCNSAFPYHFAFVLPPFKAAIEWRKMHHSKANAL